MYCDAPTLAVRLKGINPETGKHYKPFDFRPFRSDADFKANYSKYDGTQYESLILPCGKCMLCTRRYRMHWVLRCMHEARFYDQMCYLTLTVDDRHIYDVFPRLSSPVSDGRLISVDDAGVKETCSQPECRYHSLRHKPFQDFMKRLRRRLEYGVPVHRIIDGVPSFTKYHGEGKPLRYFMCGEYGDQTHRPHYHAIIFGFFPPDVKALLGHKGLFISDFLSQVWPFGFHTVAKVEPACVSYVAGYVDKKMDESRNVWMVEGVAPEYVAMSRGCSKLGTGGLGKSFFDRYWRELYPLNDDGTFARDYALTVDGRKVKMPRYYDNLLCLQSKPTYDILCAFREEVGALRKQELDLDEWLNESHRRCAVAVARRQQRDPGVQISVGS